MRILITLLATFALGATACLDSVVTEHGSGHLETRSYEVDEFSSVVVHRSLRVDIVVDPGAERSVTVTMDENLFEYLEVRGASDGALVVDANRNLDPSDDARIEIVTPTLDGVAASGAASVRVTGEISGDEVEIAASGAARISADSIAGGELRASVSGASRVSVGAGVVTGFDGEASGASSLDFEGVTIEGDADVDLSGASRAELRATGRIDGRASGASSVTVHGDPTEVDVSTTGASSVRLERQE